MNILITGGAGYIGSHTLKALLKENIHRIVVIDNLYSGNQKAIDCLSTQVGNFEFINADLADPNLIEHIFSKNNFEAVFHFAAFIEVFESTQNPLKYYSNNTANMIKLLSHCIKFGVKNFVFSSTAAVYGEPKAQKINEQLNLNPLNPYGASKMMSERVLMDTAKNSNIKYAILRYFNVAGADGIIGQNYPNATHLIKVAVQTALKKRDKMYIFGDDYNTPDGTCIRDYIHVNDLAMAHVDVLKYLQNGGNSDIFNVGYGHGYSVKEVINATKSVSGVDFDVVVSKRREGDPSSLIADSTKLRTLVGWSPKYDNLEFIIKTALEWEKNLY